MNNWYSSEVEVQRRWQEADKLTRTYDSTIQDNRLDGIRWHHRWLARLGRQLIIWGCHLQTRYDVLVLAPSGES